MTFYIQATNNLWVPEIDVVRDLYRILYGFFEVFVLLTELRKDLVHLNSKPLISHDANI